MVTLHGSSDSIPIFFPLMWHRLDITHNCVSRKKAYGFQYAQIGLRPRSYVEIYQIWIGYVHFRRPCKQTDRIFPSMQVIQHYKTKVLTDIDSEQCWQSVFSPWNLASFMLFPEVVFLVCKFTFTFSHLADAFIQSDLQLGNTWSD